MQLTQTWLGTKSLRTINWAPYLPDMSIVENVWHILKVTINEQDPHLVMEEELWIAIQEEWNKLGDKYKEGLCTSMPS